MVREMRIKEYIFPQVNWNATGSQLTGSSLHALNGEILRVSMAANFTGSVTIGDNEYMNYATILVTSGTNAKSNTFFSNTTGSYIINGPLYLQAGSLSSGTGKVFGPVEVYYR